ncbi:CD99 molecule isoform X2 [Takifugu flavidus]|uniref:CD99 molecule isoform X2 n=1 Tax=Takifugu flavidus TaxID=433684 RepID=UPI00254437B2|nr:CD99 molecule isoform X2 [Takifugu flavidus]
MKFPLEVLSLLLLVAGTLTQDLDLADFFDNDAPTEKPKVTQKPKTDGNFDLNLEDALNPDPKPDKPPVAPPKPGGAGGTFGDADLFEVGKGDYKPEGGRSGGAGNAGHDTQGGADQPQDPDLLWGQILKMLNANMPEELFLWISNLKQTIEPLLERALQLLQTLP